MNLENSQIKLLSKILPEKIDFPPASKEIKLSLSCTSFNVEIINDKNNQNDNDNQNNQNYQNNKIFEIIK